MSNRAQFVRGLFSRGHEVPGEVFDGVVDDTICPDERVEYRLSGGGLSVSGVDDPDARNLPPGDVLAVVTDRRLLFLTRSPDRVVVDVPYDDLAGVDLDSGFLRTAVTVDVWEGGTYRLSPVDGPAAEAVAYVSETSGLWQFVDALMDELDGHTTNVERHAEAGRFEQAAAALADARETATELGARVGRTDPDPLRQRVEAADRAVQRARVRRHVTHAKSCLAAARDTHLVGTRPNYTDARQHYESAREHLETAASLAAEHDIEASSVGRLRERLDRGLEVLAGQPVALATQAAERAVGTAHPEVRVERFREALDHYHDAVALGWGDAFGPTRDRETLRVCVALAAVGLVDARREYAAELEATGDALVEWGMQADARDRYRAAADQLEAALSLAREFPAPDPEPVRRDHDRLVTEQLSG